MSTSYSIFVKKHVSFMEMKSALEGALKVAFTQDPEVSERLAYRTETLGLGITLREAIGYEDDRDMKFTHFQFKISVDYFAKRFEGDLTDDWRRIASLVIGSITSRTLDCEYMVIENMQVLLRRFLPPK